MITNTIHWHDATKELPFYLTEEENEALIIAVGKDDDNLTWHQAFRKNGKWVGKVDLIYNGKELHVEPIYNDVKYWAEFPKVDFTK